MAPNSGYLTFSPSTLSSRSILEEPSKGSQEILERSQEPLEQNQEPSERSQEPLERSQDPSERSQEPLAQENGEWPQGTIEQIVELKSKGAKWPEIGAAVGLPANTCWRLWTEYKQEQAIFGPKPWDESEDKLLLQLKSTNHSFEEISAKLKRRTARACRERWERIQRDLRSTSSDKA